MDVLRERFGEASFRDAHTWQPWESGQEQAATWQARRPGPCFHLANPKLHLDTAARRSHGPDQSGSSLEDLVGFLDRSRLGVHTAGDAGLPSRKHQSGPQLQSNRQATAVDQPMWLPGWGPQQAAWGPPPLQVSFDGNPDRVALFLSQVISHLDLYTRLYPSQWAMVVAVTAVLDREVAEWVADLHNEHARELADVGLFLEALRARFEDGSRTQQAEDELMSVKQRGRTMREYICEF